MGRYRHTVDAKGRIFLPAKVREEIGTSVFVTLSLDPEYLSGYTQPQFAEIRSQMSRLPGTDPIVRKMKREILGEAIPCDLDAQGRISVTEELWSQVGIHPGDEVYIVYLYEKFEIWPAAVYDESRSAMGTALSEDLSRYDIKGV
jgi:MraZ protein